MDKKQKILICDDEEGIRESYKLILGDLYDLVMVANGPECLEALKANPGIKLVLIDIKMPKKNGIEVTREIKQRFPDVKVVVVTGYSCAEIAQDAFAAGATDYITKPFESKDIVKKVSNLTI